jgi:hypothetical protein
MKKKIVGIAFVLLSILIMSVSAFVYISDSQTVTQTVRKVVSTFTLKNPDLGDLFEGETKVYTEADYPLLGDAISITTQKGNVYLWLNSTIDELNTYYSTYTLTVKFASVAGSTYAVGDTAATLSLINPNTPSGILLDAAGAWSFDFELTTTAKALPLGSEDVPTTATIIVEASDA